MDLVLDITTSAEFWRRLYPANRSPRLSTTAPSSKCACNQNDVFSLAPPWITPDLLRPLGGRFHVMAFDEASRRQSNRHVSHVWSGPIPDGSFCDCKNGVYVSSPAFMFLVAATTLSVVQLIAFGCELCGLYSFDRNEERGFRKRKVPLLTKERLNGFLAGARGNKGYAKAMTAVSYIVENSRSPMETFDAMAMYLPYRLGGYCLEKPVMNQGIPLNARAARIAKRQTCYADMCYAEAMLDIEHHGKLDHSSVEDRASDRARVNALKEMGFEVIELTKDQVEDLLAFEYIIQRIGKRLGKRMNKDRFGATPARMTFRREVFAWNRSYGRLRL